MIITKNKKEKKLRSKGKANKRNEKTTERGH